MTAQPASLERGLQQDGRRNFLVGIVLLMGVVFLWTASNFVTQDVFEGGYNKPFLVTYSCTGAFSVYLVPFLVRHFLDRRRREYEPLPGSDPLQVSTSTLRPTFRSASAVASGAQPPAPSEKLPPLTVNETARVASIFCFFWFAANWSLNASLQYTSVASATILSSTSGFFTLALGRVFNVEILTSAKIGAVVASFTGVVLVSLSDSTSPKPTADPTSSLTPPPYSHFSNPILGDALALLSASLYATYVTFLKIRIKEESRIDMQLFFGFVGVINTVAMLPVGWLLDLIGWERFEAPYNRRIWIALLVNMVITILSDYLYVISMLKTSPILVTVGLSLTIPLAIIGDILLNVPIAPQAFVGGCLVVASFIVLGLEGAKMKHDPTIVEAVNESRTSVDGEEED